MTRYNDIQTANKRAYRDNIKRQCQIVDPNIDEATIDRVVETGGSVDVSGLSLRSLVSLSHLTSLLLHSWVRGSNHLA
jgi:t-SNARE complex subunit (syntaxin)